MQRSAARVETATASSARASPTRRPTRPTGREDVSRRHAAAEGVLRDVERQLQAALAPVEHQRGAGADHLGEHQVVGAARTRPAASTRSLTEKVWDSRFHWTWTTRPR